MPIESVIFLAIVIGSLGVFAAALVHAEWATRQVAFGRAAATPPAVNVAKKPNPASTTPARVPEMAD